MPVVAEASYGAAAARSDETRTQVRNALLPYPKVEIDDKTARRAGELLAAADDNHEGQSGVGWHDANIAAVADRLDDRVLTDNVEDFERLGVEVETYCCTLNPSDRGRIWGYYDLFVSIPGWVFWPLRLGCAPPGRRVRASFNPVLGFLAAATCVLCCNTVVVSLFQSRAGFSGRCDPS